VKKELKDFFESRGIEFYAVLDYSLARETNHAIMERESFTPRSVILFLLPYYAGECENLSRYAAARDYHLAIREYTGALIGTLRELYPESSAKGYGDHSPIDERDAALSAGLGILGDSGLLINEKYGTYVFIADVVSDISPEELGESGAAHPHAHCISCGACKRACPTGVLRGESLDCLSAITQRKGELSDSEVEMMRKFNTVWGCDLCQSSCPYNKEPQITPIAFFREERITCLTSERLAEMSKAEFNERAFAWRGRKTVERNLELLNC
jgi:epoxyqueuosine reductase